jgi:hypothetical protein
MSNSKFKLRINPEYPAARFVFFSILVIFCMTFAFQVFIRNLNLEAERFAENIPGILIEKNRAKTPSSNETNQWADEVHRHQPNAIAISGISVYPAIPPIMYCHFSIEDGNGWWSYSFQIKDGKIFPPGTNFNVHKITNAEKIRELNSKKLTLSD